MRNQKIYNIIIPHQNCPELLSRCLDSIPQREDLHIIVVDDNSDVDKKPHIDRPDVELVLMEEEQAKGAGRARNIGLDRANGKWILFADSDDYYSDFFPHFLDKYANDDITDIVYFNADMVGDKGTCKSLIMGKYIKNYILGNKNAEMALRYGFWNSWSRMVKRSLVENNGIKFEETPVGNDLLFGLTASACAKTIAVEKEIVYHYFKWPNGSITENRKKLLSKEMINNRGKKLAFYKKVGYHSNANLGILILRLVRARRITWKQACLYYQEGIRKYHLFWIADILNCIYELFQEKTIQIIGNITKKNSILRKTG